MKKYKDWLEEVWEIKEEIAKETKKMNFKEYLKYIKKLAQKSEMRLKKYKKIRPKSR